MKDEIKEILVYFEEYVKTTDMHYSEPMLNWKDLKIVLDYITNLQQENERLKDLYRKTCIHLFNIGNDELARYFQAQINECNTFTTQGVDNNEN